MRDIHVLNGHEYHSAQEIAKTHGFSRDYIARLARTGEVRGSKIGKKWYVDPHAFSAYVQTLSQRKDLQRTALVVVRKKEYRGPRVLQKGNTGRERRAEPVPSAVSTPIAHALRRAASQPVHHMARSAHGIVPIYAVHPLVELMHKLTALATAVVLVFGSYAIVDADFRHHAARQIHADALRITKGIVDGYVSVDSALARLDAWILSGDYQAAAAALFR